MSYITFPKPTPDECYGAPSEAWKYRSLIAPYCEGVGVDLASQGATTVPWALSVDLPENEFLAYSGGNPPKGPIHLRADISKNLPFPSESFDFVICNHAAEDWSRDEWPRLFREWCRILKHGGRFICTVPERERWWAYVKAGGVHNHSHHPTPGEPLVGDMTAVLTAQGMQVLFEKLTDLYPGDYTILAVAVKP